jgi:hypothetical protein
MQLFEVGAKYWTGIGGRVPSRGPATGKDTEEPFFVKTAPSGKWVWWTVTMHAVAGKRYEYIYIDAVTGKISSHCVEASADDLVPVPCAPPR